MRTPKCTICESRTTLQSTLWPEIWLCRYCIDLTLKSLWRLGVTLSNNPFVYELCSETHFFPRVAFSFYPESSDENPTCKRYHIHFDSIGESNSDSKQISDNLLDMLDDL
jgi:hypothetical protein